MPAYYNDTEPFATEWLRRLTSAGHLASGTVDKRPIQEVRGVDLEGYHQVHLFAGIGGWQLALQLAGWPADEPVWTGSCPCQPFSQAGRRRGADDHRHLWPEMLRLIRECRPPVLFGEQVASPDGLAWLDAILPDLEGEGYAVGAADLCAASVGAPHIRQRLYFVALARGERREGLRLRLQSRPPRPSGAQTPRRGAAHALADNDRIRRVERGASEASRREAIEPPRHSLPLELGDPGCSRPSERSESAGRLRPLRLKGPSAPQTGAVRGFWADSDLIFCHPSAPGRDGKYRPVEPGTFPLAHGIPGRVGQLRAYGNAIVPELAATFIQAVMESL